MQSFLPPGHLQQVHSPCDSVISPHPSPPPTPSICHQPSDTPFIRRNKKTLKHIPFSQRGSIGWQLNTPVSSKRTLWFISFFTLAIPSTLVLFCQFIITDMAQDITNQKVSWRLLNSILLYINEKHSSSLLLLITLQFGMTYLMMCILPPPLPVSGKC